MNTKLINFHAAISVIIYLYSVSNLQDLMKIYENVLMGLADIHEAEIETNQYDDAAMERKESRKEKTGLTIAIVCKSSERVCRLDPAETSDLIFRQKLIFSIFFCCLIENLSERVELLKFQKKNRSVPHWKISPRII